MEPVVLDTSPKSKNVEITINLKTQPWPMKCYRNYLINCRGLAKYPFRFHGKHQMESLVKEKEFILLGDQNCDLLSLCQRQLANPSCKHLVHIYNTLCPTQFTKEATRTTAETNTLTDYIVINC